MKASQLLQKYMISPLGLIIGITALLIACGGEATPAPAATSAPAATAVPRATTAPAAAPGTDRGIYGAQDDPRYGGVLKSGGLANSTFYDLHQTGSIANMHPQSPMYNNLIQWDPIGWQELIPDLATSWEQSDDGLTYTFSVREGVMFHDGALLTAEDVAASFVAVIFPRDGVLSPRKGLFDAVNEVVATGPMTVEFRLREPRGFMSQAIASGFNVIVRKQSLEDNQYDLRRVPDYPGTGPMRFESQEPGVSWTLQRFDEYYNPELPYLDGMEIFHLGFGAEAGAGCLANTIDYCKLIDPESARKAREHPEMSAADHSPSVIVAAPMLNHASKPFDDARVRRAVNLVIDKPALADLVTVVTNTQLSGWLPTTDPLFEEYWEQVKDDPLWRAPTDEDIAEAKRLMVEAGYEDGITGLDFLIRDISSWKLRGPAIQDALKRHLKIESDIRQVTSGGFFEDFQKSNFDLTVNVSAGTVNHIGDYWGTWYKTGGGLNVYNYSSPELDAVIEMANKELDPAKLKELVFEGIAILDRDVPFVQVHSEVPNDGWWNYVKGHQQIIKGGHFWEGMRQDLVWLDK